MEIKDYETTWNSWKEYIPELEAGVKEEAENKDSTQTESPKKISKPENALYAFNDGEFRMSQKQEEDMSTKLQQLINKKNEKKFLQKLEDVQTITQPNMNPTKYFNGNHKKASSTTELRFMYILHLAKDTYYRCHYYQKVTVSVEGQSKDIHNCVFFYLHDEHGKRQDWSSRENGNKTIPIFLNEIEEAWLITGTVEDNPFLKPVEEAATGPTPSKRITRSMTRGKKIQ